MPKKGKKQQQPQDDLDDDIAFLEACAAANQANIASAAEKTATTETPAGVSNTVAGCANMPPLPEMPSQSFPDRNFPPGEIMEYNEHIGWRSTSVEKKELERIEYNERILPELREGAEVHRRVRRWAMENVIKPGVNFFDMCAQIEEATRRLTGYQPITRGLAFPCGCSLNNCAAHYSPNMDDGRCLKTDDVMKIDFGVNINGSIIDSAFTVCFDSKFDSLLQASRDATNCGVRMAGIDARLNEIGDAIHEIFDASTLELDGKIYQIVPVSNLSGHQMKPYTIHAGKRLPIARGGSMEKMEEGELWACETFGSTGKGKVTSHGDNLSHYMVSPNPGNPHTPQSKKLLKVLQDNFTTLAFCPRMIEYIGEKKYAIPLRQLVDQRAVNPYPSLSDVKGSYVAQFEHSFILLPTRKEIISRGDDY